MHKLYWYLLRLLPATFRGPFAGVTEDGADVIEEMYSVHMEASEDARGKGSFQYLAFFVKEIGGLLAQSFTSRTRISRRFLYLPGGALAGFVITFLVTLCMGPEPYTSMALLRDPLEEPLAPYFHTSKPLPAKAYTAELMTRSNLQNIIEKFKLYYLYGYGRTIENAVAQMRSDIAFEDGPNPGELIIRYTNPNRFAAQKVTQELVTRVIAAGIRDRTAMVGMRTDFFHDQLNYKKLEWDRLRSNPKDSTGASLDRVRASYESIASQLAEANTLQHIVERRHVFMEILNPASLPFRPDLDYTTVQLAGAAFGALTGLLFQIFISRASLRAAIHSGDRT